MQISRHFCTFCRVSVMSMIQGAFSDNLASSLRSARDSAALQRVDLSAMTKALRVI